MKKLTKKYSVQLAGLLLLLALLPVSCIKDDYAAKEKATVQVTFTTRALSDETIAGNELADNERMKTLRVIVAKDSKILYNEYYTEDDFARYANGQRYKTVTFSELVTEDEEDRTFDFYAIANEEGIADWPTQITSLDQLPENITLSTSSKLIPQTAKQSIIVKIPQEGSGIQKEIMQLEFVMAKVQLVIVNETGTAQSISGISLSNADVNYPQVPLFPNESLNLFVGNKNVTMSDMQVGGNDVSISSSQTAYVYENKAPTDGYVFNATWKNNSQPPVDLSTVKDLPRGKELRITIHLKQNSTAQFDYEVLDWTDVEVDIPKFD